MGYIPFKINIPPMMPWQVSDQDASSARRARELKEAQRKRLEDGNDGNGAARWGRGHVERWGFPLQM